MRLIAIDLDGTLLNSNHEISELDKQAIRKAQELGVTVVISTGRTYFSAIDILNKNDLKVPYVITCNGSIINDFSGKILNSFPAPKKALEKVISFLYYNNYYFSLATENSRISLENSKNLLMSDFYVAKGNNTELPEEKLDFLVNLFYNEAGPNSVCLNSLSDILNHPEEIYGICAVSFNNEKLEFGINALREVNNLSIFKSAFNNFELINENCSKGHAVTLLAKDLNIPMEETMAIGDNENDLSMINMVSFGVAMGNAKEIIKESADFVTFDNNSSGVSHAISEALSLSVI
ncbi:MAG: Cof-type HAD-IIB family hydrolase [Clostridium sp.]|uniref:Cof-type HAD-IIB family hydrolase n=1 Tax=Clostridium sp. TaxID=1506 RepID=UPI003F2D5162